MTWKKYFRPVNTVLPYQDLGSAGSSSSVNKYNSWLPEVYLGPPNRLERYIQYEQMDIDHEVHAAMDTLAEFSTQPDEKYELPFDIQFNSEPSPTESELIMETLSQWCRLNEFQRRMFRTFRSTLLYGDQFFVRDPETFKLNWVDPSKVEKIIVNESRGKEIETYFVHDIDLNLQTLVATNQVNKTAVGYGNTSNVFPQTMGGATGSGAYSSAGFTGNGTQGESEAFPVNAEHIVHLSMTEGLDSSWPFGVSILESIFKVYKQKELLEDAMLIYRIHRAPERRVFFIDVGNMPPNKAQQYLERVKNEVQQKRIPNRSGGGSSVVDSAYNPLSTLEDYFFATTAEGRGSKVETLPGGDNLGEINDMLYFNNKMMRALGVPSSYLPTGPEDGSASSSDGKVGTAFIQEFRFSEKCKRHQRQIIRPLDREFKLFLKHKGITIDGSLFNLKYTEPQNFARYRQIELDSAQVAVFGQIGESKYISKRFAMKKYLGLSEDEILENEKMWREEKGIKKIDPTATDAEADLRQVGMSPADMAPPEEFDDEMVGDEEGEVDIPVDEPADVGNIT